MQVVIVRRMAWAMMLVLAACGTDAAPVAAEPGDHRVVVRADTGATHERVVSLGSERRYLAVSYLGRRSSGPDAFSVEESDESFGIA